MTNPLTNHPHYQGLSYFEHWGFALGISWRLLKSVVAFALHGTLPFMRIERRLDLDATCAFLTERNGWLESRKAGRPGKTGFNREHETPRPLAA